MVSVTITFEIFKLRYYVYCALFDLSCKLLLSIYLISAMCYTYYSTYYSSIFCLVYYRVVVKINLYQCQCQCQKCKVRSSTIRTSLSSLYTATVMNIVLLTHIIILCVICIYLIFFLVIINLYFVLLHRLPLCTILIPIHYLEPICLYCVILPFAMCVLIMCKLGLMYKYYFKIKFYSTSIITILSKGVHFVNLEFSHGEHQSH